jgi:hypothetical protein
VCVCVEAVNLYQNVHCDRGTLVTCIFHVKV